VLWDALVREIYELEYPAWHHSIFKARKEKITSSHGNRAVVDSGTKQFREISVEK